MLFLYGLTNKKKVLHKEEHDGSKATRISNCGRYLQMGSNDLSLFESYPIILSKCKTCFKGG